MRLAGESLEERPVAPANSGIDPYEGGAQIFLASTRVNIQNQSKLQVERNEDALPHRPSLAFVDRKCELKTEGLNFWNNSDV